MARSKQISPGIKTLQLSLFQDEQPAGTAAVEQPAVIPQKRTKTKKSVMQLIPFTDMIPPEDLEEPEVSVTASIPEELLVTQEPAAARLVEEREAALKAKFKQDQEARLEALKRARNKK